MKKLKRKILASALCALIIVFSMTLFFTGLGIQMYNTSRADDMTAVIENNGGNVPERKVFEQSDSGGKSYFIKIDDESQFRTRYFLVYFDDDHNISDINIEHIASVNATEAEKMAQKVLSKNDTVGYCNDFRYRTTQDHYIIFLDCTNEYDMLNSIILILLAVCVFFTVLVMLIFAALSNKVVKPFEENAKKQKQFITDASHELKTPLAIISANAEVLEYKDGGSEWVKNITGQVQYMGKLINELLTLTKLEEIDTEHFVTEVNFSHIVTEVCDSFMEVFEKKNTVPELDIEENVILNGNEEQLRRLVSVLTENASKYVSENGKVIITLKKGIRYTNFSVFNSCEIDEKIDVNRLFDRFYRPDSSRTSKTGGHGIGLSIAKEITVLHGGSIEAKTGSGGICFSASVSNRLKKSKSKKTKKIKKIGTDD